MRNHPKRALLSVSDKTGLVELAQFFQQRQIEMIATGNTYKLLVAEKIPVTPISAYTGSPEILGGRVKSLHPKIHAGILARDNNKEDYQDLVAHQFPFIDIVIVNLYPFAEKISQIPQKVDSGKIDESEILEFIDIGGVTLLRATAKNFHRMIVISDPQDYHLIFENLNQKNELSLSIRRKLAAKAFQHTAEYEISISHYFAQMEESEESSIFDSEKFYFSGSGKKNLRYGENPQQKAAFFKKTNQKTTTPISALKKENPEVQKTKSLSYNNYLDIMAAYQCRKDLESISIASGKTSGEKGEKKVTAIVIEKHQNPCGVAIAETANGKGSMTAALIATWQKALACDPMSAFGGIVSCSHTITLPLAQLMQETFLEIICAPAFEASAIEFLTQKRKNLLLITMPNEYPLPELKVHQMTDGWLMQQTDQLAIKDDPDHWQCVTEKKASAQQKVALSLAWRLVKNVKSNAIAIWSLNQKDIFGQCIGIGGGQTNRINAAELAIRQALRFEHSLLESVAASDGFFPFPDTITQLGENGIQAVVQPGGSKRDQQVIAMANKLNIAMYFTGRRHFLH